DSRDYAAHRTARADDSPAPRSFLSRRTGASLRPSLTFKPGYGSSRIIELNLMLLRLCGPPSIPLSFTLAGVLPRWMTSRFRLGAGCVSPTPSHHRLGRGLPGYLILFDPHAFVHQRQSRLGKLPSQSVFCGISMHFTATCHIPPTSSAFKRASINGTAMVEPPSFTTDLARRLRTL